MISKDIQYSALGDFDEIFASIAEDEGVLQVKMWYWTQVAKSFPLFIADSIYWRIYMLQNYLKAAFRKRDNDYGD